MFTLSSRHHPCTGCEQAPGGCKHRCQAYRDLEYARSERYAARFEHSIAQNANIAFMANRKAATLRATAKGHGPSAAFVR